MKKIISAIIIVSMLIVSQVYAANDSRLSYDAANEAMLENSRAVLKQKLTERKAFYQYSGIVQRTRGIETEMSIIDTPMGKYYYIYPPNIQVLLTKQAQLLPLQMRYYWKMADNSRLVTEKALSLGLRDLYLGFLKADMDYQLSLKKLKLQEKKYNAAKLKAESGLISGIEFEEAEYDYLKAEKDVEKCKRNRENMQRSINSFIGVPIDTAYDKVLYSELTRNLTLNPVEYYIEAALENRLEIANITEQIKIKEQHLEILGKSRAKEIYPDIRKEHEDTSLEMESLQVQLDKAKYEVENNIKSAYIDVIKERDNMDSLLATLNMQKRSYEKLKAQYEQGLISETVLLEMELAIEELQNGFNLTVYNYNTKKMKLEEAAGLGPAY
ncbi:MAG TPA: TolC family protein [Acetivibrio sp.]|uniref:TolC family protein n=1 Tax=Acetivibrio sp. TaxID=1872092 RepID=UPI002CFE7F59|nr:TolC family protein [Acetivibrio sp.]HOM01481.1 TolC family protein [Acetivibrio sp.]